MPPPAQPHAPESDRDPTRPGALSQAGSRTRSRAEPAERVLDLLIVGAGPSGLATATAAHQAGLDYEVLEKGVLVNSIFHFPRSMVFFTTPELLEIGGPPFVKS